MFELIIMAGTLIDIATRPEVHHALHSLRHVGCFVATGHKCHGKALSAPDPLGCITFPDGTTFCSLPTQGQVPPADQDDQQPLDPDEII